MISIIGAGPAGSYTAYLLAKAGQDVTLIEEHKEVGSPVQCTGIMTHSIDKFIDLKKSVVANRCNKVKVVSQNNDIDVDLDEVVVWRNLFDQQLADMAVDAGAKLLTNHQFTDLSTNEITVKDKQKSSIRKIQSDIIIGSDGPSSSVARKAGIPHNNKFYIGMQAKVKCKMDMNSFETHFGTSFPNFFGWVVPESEDTVRLGLGATKDAKDYFYKFIEKRTGKKDILCWESGIIPIHNPNQLIQKDNVYLIGDAATHVKATTGGGIIPSLKAAKTLTNAILNKRNYHRDFYHESGRELRLHLKIRNTLNRFSDKDYDKLISLMNQPKVRELLKMYDRDTPIPLVTNLLLREPRFLLFGRKLLGI